MVLLAVVCGAAGGETHNVQRVLDVPVESELGLDVFVA